MEANTVFKLLPWVLAEDSAFVSSCFEEAARGICTSYETHYNIWLGCLSVQMHSYPTTFTPIYTRGHTKPFDPLLRRGG